MAATLDKDVQEEFRRQPILSENVTKTESVPNQFCHAFGTCWNFLPQQLQALIAEQTFWRDNINKLAQEARSERPGFHVYMRQPVGI